MDYGEAGQTEKTELNLAGWWARPAGITTPKREEIRQNSGETREKCRQTRRLAAGRRKTGHAGRGPERAGENGLQESDKRRVGSRAS